MNSSMDTVLNEAPFNEHTMTCNVSHESFANIRGSLMLSFFKNGELFHNETKNISHGGPFNASQNISEDVGGEPFLLCNVTLIVKDESVNSTMNGTFVTVVGECYKYVYCINLTLMPGTHCHRPKSTWNSHTIHCYHFNH